MAFVLAGSVELVTWKQGLMVVKLLNAFRDNFHKISAILLEIDPQHRQTQTAQNAAECYCQNLSEIKKTLTTFHTALAPLKKQVKLVEEEC